MYPPGQTVTAAVPRDTIRETLCLGKITSREVHRGYIVPQQSTRRSIGSKKCFFFYICTVIWLQRISAGIGLHQVVQDARNTKKYYCNCKVFEFIEALFYNASTILRDVYRNMVFKL
jgi:hypothetical protein